MIHKTSNWLLGIASGKIALLAIVIFLLFGTLVLPREAVRAEEVSQGAGSPDTNLFYTAEELYELAELYGLEGRSAYVRARFTFDVAFPLVYAFFLVTTIGWVMGRVWPPGSRFQYLNLVPIAGMGFDFLENITVSIVMLRYPVSTLVLAEIAPYLSAVKWLFVYASFLVLGILLLYWVVRSIRSRGIRPNSM